MKSFLTIAFPVWGTVVAVGLILFFESQKITTLIVVLGGCLVVANSCARVWDTQSHSTVTAIFLSLKHLLFSAVVVVVLGLFLLCMHQCN